MKQERPDSAPTVARRDEADALVARCQEGDHQAFRLLFERYHRRVHATIYHLVTRKDELDDVVQKVFIEVYRSVRHFQRRSLFTTWLTRVAINVARAHERKLRLFERQRRAVSERDGEPFELLVGGLSVSPHERLVSREQIEAAQEILQRLPFKKRTVLILAELQEMSAPEVADILGVPPATVRTRLFYARRDFERLARKHPVFAGEGAGGEP